MDDKTTSRIQFWMTVIGGPVMMIGLIITWYFMGHNYISPPSPGLSGEELVATYYVKYRGDIMLGMSLSSALGVLYIVWSVQLTCQMWRREKVPLLSLMQLCGGILTGWLIVQSCAMWVWCARWAGTPGIEPELTKAIHVMSWYIFDMTYMVTTIQCVGCGLFAILDKKKPAIFPPWLGWVTLGVAATFFPESLLPYYDEGPLSLNGWWNLHVVFSLWVVWFAIYNYYMLQDLKRVRNMPTLGIGQAISHSSAER
jgi:hypothetical protein